MKIFVKAKAGAKENMLEAPKQKLFKGNDDKDDYYKVSVKEPPVQGRANEAITKLLAEYFKVSSSQVKIISGRSSKIKIFEIS